MRVALVPGLLVLAILVLTVIVAVLVLTWTGTLEWIAYVSYEYDIPIIPTVTSPWYPDL